MLKKDDNRLVTIFRNFANHYELPHKKEEGVWRLGIPVNNQLIHMRYKFHDSENSYEFGTPLAKIDSSKQASFSLYLLKSEPAIGLTERIVGDTFFLLGSREKLKHLPDSEIHNLFEEDAYRITEYFKNLHLPAN